VSGPAIRALSAWSPHNIPHQTITAMQRAVTVEPDPKRRARMQQLLRGFSAGRLTVIG